MTSTNNGLFFLPFNNILSHVFRTLIKFFLLFQMDVYQVSIRFVEPRVVNGFMSILRNPRIKLKKEDKTF